MTVMPVPLNDRLEVAWKFVPVTVKLAMLAPCVAETGKMELTDGAGGSVTENPPIKVAFCESGLVTMTSCGPAGAAKCTVIFAMIWVGVIGP